MSRKLTGALLALLVVPAFASFNAACGSDASEQQQKSAHLTVIATTSSALDLATLTVSITLTPAGGGSALTLTPTLQNGVSHGRWTGSIDVPAGSYTLHGEARDSNGTRLFSTTANGASDPAVNVASGDQTVSVILQEEGGNTHVFDNAIPHVIALTDRGSSFIQGGETRTFDVVVRDPDLAIPGRDALAFEATAKSTSTGSELGTLAAISGPGGDAVAADATLRTYTFSWTADATTPATLSLPYTVAVGAFATDQAGARVGLTMTITVGAAGQLAVQASVNQWPAFGRSAGGYGITTDRNPFLPMNVDAASRSSVTLLSNVTDPDGDALTYQWSAADDCKSFVSFDAPAASATTFRLNADPGALEYCKVTLAVDDGHGAVQKGTLSIPFARDIGYCGDAICEDGEDCVVDCGFAPVVECGNGICEADEMVSCQSDCGITCGDGICSDGELNCPQECDPPPTEYCGDGACNNGESDTSCYSDCGYCGDNVCTAGYEDPNTCFDCGFNTCGNGGCDPGDETSCPQDCASLCGNGICDPSDEANGCAATDCSTCGNGQCDPDDEFYGCSEECL